MTRWCQNESPGTARLCPSRCPLGSDVSPPPPGALLTTGLIYGVANGNENKIGTLSAGSGFAQRYRSAATSGLMPILCEDIVANCTSPIAVTSTSSASNTWAIVGVANKATLMALPMPPSFDRSNSSARCGWISSRVLCEHRSGLLFELTRGFPACQSSHLNRSRLRSLARSPSGGRRIGACIAARAAPGPVRARERRHRHQYRHGRIAQLHAQRRDGRRPGAGGGRSLHGPGADVYLHRWFRTPMSRM